MPLLDEFGNPPIDRTPEPARVQPERDEFGNPPAFSPPKPSAEDNVIAAQGASPDEAAKAAKLGQKIGVPPSIVGIDPQKFQDDATRREALEVIAKNNNLRRWVGKDVNNAKLASDDMPALDRAMNAAEEINSFSPMRATARMHATLKKMADEPSEVPAGFGSGEPSISYDPPTGAQLAKDWGNVAYGLAKGLPAAAAGGAVGDLEAMLLAIPRAATGIKDPFAPGVTYVPQSIEGGYLGPRGLGWMGPPQTPEETGGMIVGAMLGPFKLAKAAIPRAGSRLRPLRGEVIPPDLKVGRSPLEDPHPTFDLGRGEFKETPEPKEVVPTPESELAISEGEVPRPGTDPAFDKVHIEEVKNNVDSFDKAFALAQESKLRERSPEAFERAVRESVGDRQMYLPSTVVEKLYRDAEPKADDNVLGWANNIEQKVATSLALGTDLQVPVSQALAHLDPAVWTAIKDAVRFHEVGVSKEEAKALSDKKPEDYETQDLPEDLSIKSGQINQDDKSAHEIQIVDKAGTPHYRMEVQDVSKSPSTPGMWGVGYVENLSRKYKGLAPQLYQAAAKYVEGKGGTLISGMNTNRFSDAVLEKLKTAGLATSTKVGDRNLLQIRSEKEETPLGQAIQRERKALYLDPLFKEPKAAGMDGTQFALYSRKIEQTDQATYEKALAKAQALVKKRLGPEWKADLERIKQEVTTDFHSSPMVVADRFIRLGELPTEERVPRRKLDEEAVANLGGADLSRYTVKTNGLHPDDIAPQLGFNNGAELVNALNKFEEGRKGFDETKGARQYLSHLIDKEADERMERRYGSLQGNVLDEARDMVTTASHIDILTDELKQLAKLGELPFTKEALPNNVEQMFRDEHAHEVSYEKYRRAAEQNAKVAEKALLAGGFREAFQAKLRQYTNVLMAKEAKAFDKKMATAERGFRRIVRQDSRGGIDQDYFDNAKKVLADVGFTDQRGQEPAKSLSQLISESSGQLAVASWIAEPGTITGRMAKEYKDLTVEEFHGLNESIRSLLHVGGDLKKVDSVHGAAEKDNVVVDIRRELERFGVRPPWDKQSYVRRAGSLANYVSAAHVLVERLFDYTDKFDPNGPITRFIDRPLRDGYNKELELIEQVVGRLKKLEKFTDTSVNDVIDNKVIVDPIDNLPVPMTRKMLRNMMLHMGSESGLKKVTEGFGIKVSDAYDLVRNNATKADFDWVNGMHGVFDFLWKPASEMQRRYTGVEADPIEARPYTLVMKDGTAMISNGGYAPVFYDRTRTNIEGDLSLKGDLFDKKYVAAVPAHGYTMPRTDYKGWVDLNGTLMASRLYQMVHDIAFREPVRNAQKVIADPEFMLAMNKYWGPEYAGLLHGWLRDIANIHNSDDAFAQGFARFLSYMRQATVSSLVNMNPGTILKHGATALSMSLAQTTPGKLAGAFKDLGVMAVWEAGRDLLRSNKVSLTPEERANLVAILKDQGTRDFIMNSSPLFRNRARSYPDTIRGAFERASEAGPLQSVRNLQSISDRMGRFGVALSDMVSAGPIWLSTYKDALARGGDHADAAFEADRVTARAHGSSFYGDKPAVMRLPNTASGEVAKSLVSLYAFWNHMANNVMQWGWDAQARGARGARSEPGADFGSLIERVFLYAVVPIAIEEMASPALSDEKKSWGHLMFAATLRYFGGMIVGLREATNYWASGYEPSVGMIGNAFKTLIVDPARDVGGRSKNAITHAFAALGALGVPFANTQTGRVIQGAEKQLTGQERPRTLQEYRALYRKGYIRPGR